MAAAPLDLAVIGRLAPASDVVQADVAVFKSAQGENDKESVDGQRVLSDSESYLAYTLKNGRALRFLDRSNNRRGVLKAHTNAIHAVRFVNYRSNVGASAAENEFFVWVVTDESGAKGGGAGESSAAEAANARLTVNIYVRLEDPVTVHNFTFFINPTIGVPDVFILYGRSAAVLECSTRIQHYRGTTVATLAKDSREIRRLNQPASARTLCCAHVGEWFVFTTEPTLVVACTLRHRSTPAWAACGGAVIESMQMLDASTAESPAVLLAASTTTVIQWSLSGSAEPTRVRSFTFGGHAIRSVLNSRNTFAVFNDAHQVALMVYEGETDSFQTTVFDMDTNVTPPGVRFNRTPNYCIVLVSNTKSIRMYQLMLDAKSGATRAMASHTPQSAQSLSPTPSPASPRHTQSPVNNEENNNRDNKEGENKNNNNATMAREGEDHARRIAHHDSVSANESHCRTKEDNTGNAALVRNRDNSNDNNTNTDNKDETSRHVLDGAAPSPSPTSPSARVVSTTTPSSQVIADPAIVAAGAPALTADSPASARRTRSSGLTSTTATTSLLAAVTEGRVVSHGPSSHAITLSPTKSLSNNNNNNNNNNTNTSQKNSTSTSVLSGLIQQLEKGNLRAAAASPSSLTATAPLRVDRTTPSSVPSAKVTTGGGSPAPPHHAASARVSLASTFPASQSRSAATTAAPAESAAPASRASTTTSSSDAMAHILNAPQSAASAHRTGGVVTTSTNNNLGHATVKSHAVTAGTATNPRTSASQGRSSHVTPPAVVTASPPLSSSAALSSQPLPPPAAASAAAPTTTTTLSSSAVPSSSSSAAARVALHNGALPQTVDGPLSSAASQSDECIRKEVEDLQTVIKNVMQIAELTPHQVLRDHEQLIHLALEAQMTELQNSFAALEKQSDEDHKSGGAGAAAGREEAAAAASAAKSARRGAGSLADEEAYNTFAIVKLIAPISKEIAAGVTRGLQETLRGELDHALRNALGSSVRDSQKAVIKRRLDEALNQSSAFFTREVATRLQDFVSHEMTHALDRYAVLLQQSQEENRQLRAALQRVVGAEDVMREMTALREELQTLKLALSSGELAYLGSAATGGAGALGANPSSFQPHAASPETMLSTAVHLIEQGKPSQGLEYIVSVDQPALTLQLLKRVGADVYSSMVSDATVRNELWANVLRQLCRKEVMEKGSEDILAMTELMLDVLADREDMTTATTAMAQQLMSDLRHFIWRQRALEPDGPTLQALRSLEKSLL